MNVEDLQVYHYSVDVEDGELPAVIVPRFGPPFTPRRVTLRLSTGDDSSEFSVSGPTGSATSYPVRAADWHPSHGPLGPQTAGSEGWAPWFDALPERILMTLRAQIESDVDHLQKQALCLVRHAHHLVASDALARVQ